MGETVNGVDNPSFHRRIATISHVAIILSIFCLAMIHLESVLKPFFIALGIYFVLKPGADWLSKNSFPVLLSYLTMLLLFILIITSTAFFAWSQAQNLVEDEERQEDYNSKLDTKWKKLKDVPIIGPAIKESVKGDGGTLGGDLQSIGIGSGGSATDLITSVVSQVGSVVTTSITVLFFLIFIIFEAHLLPGRIERAWPGSATERVEIIQTQIEEGINTYIIVKTGCGLGSAIIAAFLMFIFGIDLWFVWAVMTFILNYVPYIGSLIATIPPLILGLIILKPAMLLLMTVLLLVNQQLWGNYIETKWAGRALDLSPVVLLLITAFSFWLWGITGMILAVPLFVIVKIVLENIEETRPIAIMLSERAPTLEEAWRDALKDGNLSTGEFHKLSELQKRLGVTDNEVVRIAGRSAAQTILKRGKAKPDEIEFVLRASVGMSQHQKLVAGLKMGKLPRDVLRHLEETIGILNSGFEEE
ncbi:MAG: AI-2E family transporter [Euryarchaeota archaeon]|jgi:predicted PurR-regulated permease PerM|nr:AI-2E family transporter [Euryarchaeota archaeon]MBT5184159.1 AI-2E family transporter [Euryarchaeota archaeon]